MPPIGTHFRIARFFKNENPQNILVVYAKLQAGCAFEREGGLPKLGFYWLMNGDRYKPVHSLIQNAIRKHARFEALSEDPAMSRVFEIAVQKNKKLGAEISGARMRIRARADNQTCVVETLFPTEKDSKRLFLVESFFGESRKTLLPPFRKLTSITVRGILPESQTPMRRYYSIK